MTPPGPDRPDGRTSSPSPATWRQALLLVACVHLLTTAGTWSLTDHVEYAFVARRLIDHGGFALAEPGVRSIAALPWLVPGNGETLRTRLQPVTALTLVPLLALDRALGLEDPARYGRILHLQGHLFVIAGLAFLAWAVRAGGASQGATAAAVALTGLSWPVWSIARRIGPEPILLALVCLFIAAAGFGARRRSAARFAVCAVLPWTSPTGSTVGLALAAATLLDAWLDLPRPERTLGRLPWAAAWGLFLGVASVALVWNRLYHGDWLLGGYAPYAARPFFGVVAPTTGLLLHLRALVVEGPVLFALSALGLRAAGSPRANGLTLALVLTGALLLLFASFYQPEPSRRFAVVWPAFGAIVGRTWDRLRLPLPAPQALVALGALTGFYWLIFNEGRRYPGPGGLFYPNVLWVERYLSGAPAWQLLPAAGLLLLGVAAGIGTWRLLGTRPA
jgi:hypothetical protein